MPSFSLPVLYLMAACLLSHSHVTVSQPSCKSLKSASNKTFDNCKDLPTQNAVLQWTYDPAKASLSMAYTAPLPKGATTGWVGYGLNPNGTGMAGAQALVAHKPKASSPVEAATYDLRSYSDVRKGPISYKVTSLSAVESSGVYTIFATWASPLKQGESSVNQVWQVGPLSNAGMPAPHPTESENLSSKMKLNLIGNDAGGPAPSSTPTGSPGGPPSSSTPTGSPGGPASSSTPTASAAAPLLLLLTSTPAVLLLASFF